MVWREGRKEGWKEEEREGSLGDKFVPKKEVHTHPELAGTRTGDYSLYWIRSQTG